MPVLDEVLAEAGIGWADLDAIGVGTGPGNFTGTRIAVAAARGLALGLGIPAIGVDRFDASALGRPGVVVAVPAPRGQVWVRAPGGTPTLADTAPEAAIFDPVRPPVHPLAEAIARIAAARLAAARRSGSVTGLARPAPLYLRGADAAPPSDPPPALID